MVKFNTTKKIKKVRFAKNDAIKLNKPKMVYENSFLKWRYFSSLLIIIGCLVVLIGKAASVQIINSDTLTDEADKRSLRIQEIQSVRGSILNRHGQLLSVSVPMYSIITILKIFLTKILSLIKSVGKPWLRCSAFHIMT